MRTCSDCKWCVKVDYGYSNWTVEGTNVYCAKKLHPNDGHDNWYGENPDNLYAEQCAGFLQGPSIYIDVDGEVFKELTAEELEIYHMVFPK